MVIKPKNIDYKKNIEWKSLISHNSSEWDYSAIIANNEIWKIKETINDILSATNIYDYLKKDTNWRHIYKLNTILTRHILSSISKEYSNEKRKEIIKEQIKELLDLKTDTLVFLKNNNIYIINTWTNKLITIKNKTITNKRFDWYSDEEVEFLINENLWKNYNPKEILIELLDEINLSSLNIKQIISFITNDYKWYLLNWYIKKIEQKLDIEHSILKAISWKLLRDNFSIAKEYIINEFFYNILYKLLNNTEKKKEIEKKLKKEIANKYLDLSNKNFSIKNIKKLYNIYILELNSILQKEINRLLNTQINLDKQQINTISKEYIKNILKISKKEIIEKNIEILVENIFKNIINSTIIINKNITLIFKEIISNKTEFTIKNSTKKYDVIKFTSETKKIINQKSILEKQKSILEKQKEKYNKTTYNVQNYDKKDTNKINNLLKKINLDNIKHDSIAINKLWEKIPIFRDKIKNINSLINKLSNNIIKKNINILKIKKFKKTKDELIKKINYIQQILNLLQEESNIQEKREEQKNRTKEIKNIETKIKINIDELNILDEKLKEFKNILTKKIIENTLN